MQGTASVVPAAVLTRHLAGPVSPAPRRSLNAANWQWLSASTFFSQYFRVYSPIS